MLGNLYPIGARVHWTRKSRYESGVVVASRVGLTMHSRDPVNQYRVEQENQSRHFTLPGWFDEPDLAWENRDTLWEWSAELGRHVPCELAKA